jgi:hypothetical protein
VYVQFVSETFGDADGIGVVDESVFIKKGTHSVRVLQNAGGVAGEALGERLMMRSAQFSVAPI